MQQGSQGTQGQGTLGQGTTKSDEPTLHSAAEQAGQGLEEQAGQELQDARGHENREEGEADSDLFPARSDTAAANEMDAWLAHANSISADEQEDSEVGEDTALSGSKTSKEKWKAAIDGTVAANEMDAWLKSPMPHGGDVRETKGALTATATKWDEMIEDTVAANEMDAWLESQQENGNVGVKAK